MNNESQGQGLINTCIMNWRQGKKTEDTEESKQSERKETQDHSNWGQSCARVCSRNKIKPG